MKNTFGPYSPIRKAGNFYFISGQVGVDPETKNTARNIHEQTSQALMNLSTLLEDNDLNLDDIVKTTIFLTDMSLFSEVNEVYQGFFSELRPARSTIGVAQLPNISTEPLLIEIEAIAYKESKK